MANISISFHLCNQAGKEKFISDFDVLGSRCTVYRKVVNLVAEKVPGLHLFFYFFIRYTTFRYGG